MYQLASELSLDRTAIKKALPKEIQNITIRRKKQKQCRDHNDYLSLFSLIILAGGESRRMGSDKAMLMLNGRIFLDTLIDKGKEAGFGEIIISGHTCAYPAAKIVLDIIAKRGA